MALIRTKLATALLRLLQPITPRLLTKYRAAAGQMGHLSALCYAINRLLDKFSMKQVIWRYLLVAQSVPERPWLPERRGRTIEVREIYRSDLSLAKLPVPRQAIEYRFNQGVICLGAFKHGNIVGCIWLSLGPFEEDEVRCRFVPLPVDKAAWDLDVYVMPEHRGGFVFLRLWDAANTYLRERGIEWSLSRISAFNVVSVASHEKLNARAMGSATFLRLGACQIMFSSLTPSFHLSLGLASTPCMLLRAIS